jgi:CHAT domain-containing protein
LTAYPVPATTRSRLPMQTSRLLTSINASVNGGPYPHLKVPNVSVIQFLTKGPLKSNAKAGVLENPDPGDVSYDLPFSEKEARTIGEILPNSQALVRKNATETAVKQMSGEINIFHIASHGIFDRANPLNSGLRLQGDTTNDGVLSVEELYETELDASLLRQTF